MSTFENLDALKLRLVTPSDPEYEELRLCWNLDAAGRPSAIALPTNEQEVLSVIQFVTKSELKLCVSAGKHSSNCSISDVLVLDLRNFTKCDIDPATKTAKVGPGVKLGAFDAACAPFNLATTTGTNPDTGVSGLALGGGAGFLVRKHGYTCDNLVSARVVLLNGTIVNASKDENADLFWAIRGGGGNFGVVVEFTFQLHELPNNSMIYAGALVYIPLSLLSFVRLQEDPSKAVYLHRDHWKSLENDHDWTGMMILPGSGPLVSIYAYFGDPNVGKAKMDGELSKLGRTMINRLRIMNYHTEVQTLSKGKDGKGQAQGYWSRTNVLLTELTDEVIKTIWNQSRNAPNSNSAIVIMMLGGKGAEIPVDATAFANRHAKYWVLIFGTWDSPGQRDNVVEWSKKTCNLLKEIQSKSNGAIATMHDGDPVVDTLFGSNKPRLMKLKDLYDPKNILCFNQNIKG